MAKVVQGSTAPESLNLADDYVLTVYSSLLRLFLYIDENLSNLVHFCKKINFFLIYIYKEFLRLIGCSWSSQCLSVEHTSSMSHKEGVAVQSYIRVAFDSMAYVRELSSLINQNIL